MRGVPTMAENEQRIVTAEEIRDRAILNLSKFVKLYGLSPSESRLFSLMFLEDSPMTLDEMSGSLGMSKTSMSTGIHSLLDADMVEETWKKGVRKDLYRSEDDLYKTFVTSFRKKWISEINRNMKSFFQLKKDIQKQLQNIELDQYPELHGTLSRYAEKVDYIIHFYRWLEDV